MLQQLINIYIHDYDYSIKKRKYSHVVVLDSLVFEFLEEALSEAKYESYYILTLSLL